MREPSSELVRREWERRVVAEYQSAAITQHLTLWLIQLGVARELVDDGLRIVADELDHAELSRQVLAEAAGSSLPTLNRNHLALARNSNEPLERDAVRASVRVFCLGETLAVPLFSELRANCTVSTARLALDRILRDEVRHRQFGWDLLGYFLESMPDARAWAEHDFAEHLALLSRLYSTSGAAEPVGPIERAWGLMPSELYGQLLTETIEREYEPRLRALGLKLRA